MRKFKMRNVALLLLKAKKANVGEIRHRKNGPHQKQQNGKWIKVKKGQHGWVPIEKKKKGAKKDGKRKPSDTGSRQRKLSDPKQVGREKTKAGTPKDGKRVGPGAKRKTPKASGGDIGVGLTTPNADRERDRKRRRSIKEAKGIREKVLALLGLNKTKYTIKEKNLFKKYDGAGAVGDSTKGDEQLLYS